MNQICLPKAVRIADSAVWKFLRKIRWVYSNKTASLVFVAPDKQQSLFDSVEEALSEPLQVYSQEDFCSKFGFEFELSWETDTDRRCSSLISWEVILARRTAQPELAHCIRTRYLKEFLLFLAAS